MKLKALGSNWKTVVESTEKITIIKVSATNILMKSTEEQFRIIESFSKLINSLSIPIQIISTSETINLQDLFANIDDKNYLNFLTQKLESEKITFKEFKIVLYHQDNHIVDNNTRVIERLIRACGLELESINEYKFTNIIPQDMKPSWVKVNENYTQTLYVQNWPSSCYYGWLDNIYNSDLNIDTSMFIHPVDKQSALKYLDRKLAENLSNSIIETEDGEINADQFNEKIVSATTMREHLYTNDGKFYFMSFYVTVKSKTLETLQRDVEYAKLLLSGLDIEINECYLRQDDGHKCTQPLGIDFLKKKYNFTTPVLKHFFPFISSNIIDKGGIFLGDNLLNKSPVIIDPFKYKSALMYILGRLGGGKSYLTKLFIKRLLQKGVQIEIWDISGEYIELKKMINDSKLKIIHYNSVKEFRKEMQRYLIEMDHNTGKLKPRFLIIDEFWQFLEDLEIMKGIEYITLTGRKKYQGLCVITQMIEHLTQNAQTLTILRNASIKAIMQLEPNEAKIVHRELNLTKEELSFIVSADNEGILFAGSRHIQFKAVASPQEHDIITTDPRQRAALNSKGVVNIASIEKTSNISKAS